MGCHERQYLLCISIISVYSNLDSGLLEIEKIFFLKRSNRNYQAAAALRASDLVSMPPEMRKIHLEHQVTRATLYNSFNLPQTPDSAEGEIKVIKFD